MKRLYTAKSAGFCFGVARAVRLAEAALGAGPCCSLGPLIHNAGMVRALESRGLSVVEDAAGLPEKSRALIRSHGAGREDYAALREKGAQVIDATCPKVAHIHKIVERASQEGRQVIIIGDRTHPEVRATASYCAGALICGSAEELGRYAPNLAGIRDRGAAMVFQTTQTRQNLEFCSKILKKQCTNAEIFDTICSATSTRQREAQRLAAFCDAMVVVGDKHSANSAQLAELCRERCDNVQFIENAGELDIALLENAASVGITGGASAPAWIIKEVKQKMSDAFELEEMTAREETEPGAEPETEAAVATSSEAEPETEAAAAPTPEAEPVAEAAAVPAPEAEPVAETAAVPAPEAEPVTETAAAPASETEPETEAQPEKDSAPDAEKSFHEMLEDSIRTIYNGDKVTGVVAAITPTEISVDLGTKQSGYIPISEFTDDPNAKIEDIIKVGDPIEATVVRVNDVEGTVMLSKRRLDAVKNWSDIEAAREDGSAVEGVVTEENKGGVVVNVRGLRVFVPASQSGLSKDEPMSQLVGQTVRLKITEANRARKRIVGSIRAVASRERKARLEKLWEELEPGARFEGVVKSLTSYGAFVDIGGIDGMVHVSELSWGRIHQPSEVVKVGDKLNVYVISFDREHRRISLGYKDPNANPWKKFIETCAVGDVVKAKIVKLMPFGAFAEVMPDVDGLIHISQLADHRVNSAAEVVHVGDIVDVKITHIDEEKQKISLSIRALLEPEREQRQKKPSPEREPDREREEPKGPEEDALVYEVSATGEAMGNAPEE